MPSYLTAAGHRPSQHPPSHHLARNVVAIAEVLAVPQQPRNKSGGCMLPATFFTRAKTYVSKPAHFRKARQPAVSAAAAARRPRVHRTRPAWSRKLPSPQAARLDGNRSTTGTEVQGGSILQAATRQPIKLVSSCPSMLVEIASLPWRISSWCRRCRKRTCLHK